ncbi:11095_t:CDS:2 [Gigaspora margarita]|uniref:11095_t:CDS:1 n=1 Tax=Gigaspora margarita TaxID=4874 RepID=A0ABN7W3Q2_GIGMA|nr:11095_t:CDS:2 [Gigaspora margarita]
MSSGDAQPRGKKRPCEDNESGKEKRTRASVICERCRSLKRRCEGWDTSVDPPKGCINCRKKNIACNLSPHCKLCKKKLDICPNQECKEEDNDTMNVLNNGNAVCKQIRPLLEEVKEKLEEKYESLNEDVKILKDKYKMLEDKHEYVKMLNEMLEDKYKILEDKYKILEDKNKMLEDKHKEDVKKLKEGLEECNKKTVLLEETRNKSAIQQLDNSENDRNSSYYFSSETTSNESNLIDFQYNKAIDSASNDSNYIDLQPNLNDSQYYELMSNFTDPNRYEFGNRY